MEAYLKTTIHATLLFIYILYIHWLANFLIHHVLIILFFCCIPTDNQLLLIRSVHFTVMVNRARLKRNLKKNLGDRQEHLYRKRYVKPKVYFPM
jgi:hypothetical protein